MALTVTLIYLLIGQTVCTLSTLHAANRSGTPLTKWGGQEERAAMGDRADDFSVKCELQGSPRDPAFSLNGDYIIGGVFSIHFYVEEMSHEYTKRPDPQKCTGRSVNGKKNGQKTHFITPAFQTVFSVAMLDIIIENIFELQCFANRHFIDFCNFTNSIISEYMTFAEVSWPNGCEMLMCMLSDFECNVITL